MSAGEGMRPLYFMVPFWGRRYREYFVDLCLPSLLAPNNLPLLRAEDGHRFLMATTREDWEAIEGLPIMGRLRAHATPTWIEVGDPQALPEGEIFAQYNTTIWHQNHCQKKMVEVAYRDRAYGCLLCPDFILSDNLVATLLKYAREGYHLVLCPALRQKQEAVLEELRRRGLLDETRRLSQTAQALTLTPRDAADLFVRHLHPEMWSFEEGGDHVPPPRSPFYYWRVPGERGMLLHTFFGIPILMDYAVIPADHAQCLDRDTLENIYYSRNFADRKWRVIEDSDETCMVSLTPESTSFTETEKEHPLLGRLFGYSRLRNLRESMKYYAGRNRDTMRRDLFRMPIRLHKAGLDEVWANVERRSNLMIRLAVGDYYRVSRPPHTKRFPAEPSLDPRAVLMDIPARIYASVAALNRHLGFAISIVGRRVGLLLCGDHAALKWWRWRLRKLVAGMMRRPFEEPRPPMP